MPFANYSKQIVRQGKQKGVSSIEYGLLAALIALVAIVGMSVLGGANEAGWDAWVARVIEVIAN